MPNHYSVTDPFVTVEERGGLLFRKFITTAAIATAVTVTAITACSYWHAIASKPASSRRELPAVGEPCHRPSQISRAESRKSRSLICIEVFTMTCLSEAEDVDWGSVEPTL